MSKKGYFHETISGGMDGRNGGLCGKKMRMTRNLVHHNADSTDTWNMGHSMPDKNRIDALPDLARVQYSTVRALYRYCTQIFTAVLVLYCTVPPF